MTITRIEQSDATPNVFYVDTDAGDRGDGVALMALLQAQGFPSIGTWRGGRMLTAIDAQILGSWYGKGYHWKVTCEYRLPMVGEYI